MQTPGLDKVGGKCRAVGVCTRQFQVGRHKNVDHRKLVLWSLISPQCLLSHDFCLIVVISFLYSH